MFVLGNHEAWDGKLHRAREVARRAAEQPGVTLLDDGEAALHGRTRGVIEAALARPRTTRLVIVTHHAPHPICLLAASCTGWAAGNAASDLSALTDAGRVPVWMHGHVHATTDLLRPGGTRIVCNAARPGFTTPGFLDDC